MQVNSQKNDPHHCHCFQIGTLSPKVILKMEQNGFKKQILEEDHGQIFSRVKRIDEHTQIHFKVLPDRIIESEMEYPPDYPFAHINSTHSYSAHNETQIILDQFSIPHKLTRVPPITCIEPEIIDAKKPSHWISIAVVCLIGAVVAAALVGYGMS